LVLQEIVAEEVVILLKVALEILRRERVAAETAVD
jgi:hypothetical protein